MANLTVQNTYRTSTYARVIVEDIASMDDNAIARETVKATGITAPFGWNVIRHDDTNVATVELFRD